MEPGFRTPLVDFFRRGEVARDIRLLAARGALAPRAHEQLALLVLLVRDQDPDVARAAESTLAAIPRASLAAFLTRSDVPTDVRNFLAERGIEAAGTPEVDPAAPLLEVEPQGEEPVVAVLPPPGIEPPRVDAGGQEGAAEEKGSAVTRIASMTIAQRMTLAMKGTREERAILIRDPNKIVSVAVLSSPKVTEQEVESFAKMANVSDEILRIIASTRAWVKNYSIALALTRNPKTPVALSMNLLSRLIDRDLRAVSIDRNVPEILRITARKKVVFDK